MAIEVHTYTFEALLSNEHFSFLLLATVVGQNIFKYIYFRGITINAWILVNNCTHFHTDVITTWTKI